MEKNLPDDKDIGGSADGEGLESDFYEHLRIVVDKGQSLLRIDKYLLNRIENTSRNRIQHAADAGNIRVNEKNVKSSYRVKPGDVVSIVLPHPPRDTEIIPEDIALDIVFEDDDILVVNKPVGMVVHPGYNNYTGTLVNALAFHFLSLQSEGNNELKPGLVHRIDKDTSGLLLTSKNESALTFLARQFFDHSIDRVYMALVWGILEKEGTVTGYIGRSHKDRRVMEVFADEEKGKWSVTHYQIIENFAYCTLIACKLETGRTHQIRAHMKHIGHPLFGDVTYGGNYILKGTATGTYKQFVENCFKLIPSQALHAQTIGFVHPSSRKKVKFEIPPPENFLTLLEKWRAFV